MRVDGRVGGFFNLRIIHTEHSYNYKLRATWLTPELIRSSARFWQLRERLSDDQTRALVAEAETPNETVVLVEIDPREGSGVIPPDWVAVLRAKGSNTEVVGTAVPSLRSVKALSGVFRRDYNYELFWVKFHLTDEKGVALFSPSDADAELVVYIYNKKGQVAWPIPDSIRQRLP